MGFPRKDDSARLYRDRSDKSYLVVVTGGGRNVSGTYEAIANVYSGSSPRLGSAGVSPSFLRKNCKRVEWSDLPAEWQEAFRSWMRDWDEEPEQIRGFWKVGNQPR